jgi:hypothetical protein
MKQLSSVTLIGIDTVDPNRLSRVLTYCESLFGFARSILHSDRVPTIPHDHEVHLIDKLDYAQVQLWEISELAGAFDYRSLPLRTTRWMDPEPRSLGQTFPGVGLHRGPVATLLEAECTGRKFRIFASLSFFLPGYRNSRAALRRRGVRRICMQVAKRNVLECWDSVCAARCSREVFLGAHLR